MDRGNLGDLSHEYLVGDTSVYFWNIDNLSQMIRNPARITVRCPLAGKFLYLQIYEKITARSEARTRDLQIMRLTR